MFTNQELIEHLEQTGVLRSARLKEALVRFPREYFVPKELLESAYEDHPLPIGEGQTISQPYTVVFMLEELGVKAGDKVLEIGAGSGWQTALLSYLVSNNEEKGQRPAVAPASPAGGLAKAGHVWAYEIRKEVANFGRDNLKRFNLKNVDYVCGDVSAHWQKHAPYNRIIAGAAFGDEKEIQRATSLLKIGGPASSAGGRLAVPTLDNDIRVMERVTKSKFKEKIFEGFVFVPITH